MKSNCVTYPAKEPIILIRASQVAICDGNTCAAALLSFLEYWHNIKLDMQGKALQANQIAEMHGDQGTQDTSLLQFHSEAELEAGIMVYKRQTIRDALKKLVEWEFIEIHGNPNPRYKFDKTRYFLYKPAKVQKALKKLAERSGESTGTSGKNTARARKVHAPSAENAVSQSEIPGTRTETTAETTAETTTEKTGAPSAPEKKPRKRTPAMDMWDALTETFGTGPQTKSERGKWNAAIKELLDAGVQPGDVPGLVEAYFALYRGVECNPRALANNLSAVKQCREYGPPQRDKPQKNGRMDTMDALDGFMKSMKEYGYED